MFVKNFMMWFMNHKRRMTVGNNNILECPKCGSEKIDMHSRSIDKSIANDKLGIDEWELTEDCECLDCGVRYYIEWSYPTIAGL